MAKKLRISMQTAMTFEEGIEEFLLNCEARNLRQGTMKHYRDSIKQLYRYIPPDIAISEIDEDTWDSFRIAMRGRGDLNDMSMFTYGRDMKTILHFFMKQGWLPHLDLPLPKTDKSPTETYTKEVIHKGVANLSTEDTEILTSFLKCNTEEIETKLNVLNVSADYMLKWIPEHGEATIDVAESEEHQKYREEQGYNDYFSVVEMMVRNNPLNNNNYWHGCIC